MDRKKSSRFVIFLSSVRAQKFMVPLNWMLVGAALVGGFIAFKHYINTANGRYRWDKFIVHAPLVGEAVEVSTLPLADRILRIESQDGIRVVRPLESAGGR